MTNKRMLKVLPFASYSNVSCAVYAGIFVPLMIKSMDTDPETIVWTSQTKQKYCLLAFIGLGLGEIFGSFLIGYL